MCVLKSDLRGIEMDTFVPLGFDRTELKSDLRGIEISS